MSLINTRLTNFRGLTPVDKWEVRASQYGIFDLFRNQTASPTGIITPDLATKAIAAVGTPLEIPVLDAETYTIGNVTQPVVITGSPTTSQLYAVTFVNYNFNFLIHPAQHFNNNISMQREFDRQMNGFTYALLNDLDQAGETALEAGKTQVLNAAAGLGGRYALDGNDVVVGALAEQDAIIGDLNPIFSGQDYFGRMDVVGNPSLESHIRNRLIEQGGFNDRDKTYQYSDKVFTFSNEISNAAGHKATGFAVQADSIGYVQQFSRDSIMGNTTHQHVWDIELLPIAGFNIGVYQYSDAVDGNTLSGAATVDMTSTKAEAYGFHTAFAFITPYVSAIATDPTSIMKFAIATT